MKIRELEAYASTFTMGVIEINQEIHSIVREVEENENLHLDCEELWSHFKEQIIKALNDIG